MAVKAQVSLFRNLLYLQELVSEGTITRVALKNGIKASNLSRMIKETEAFFGKPLFLRTVHGLIPSRTALDICEKVNDISKVMQSLIEEKKQNDHMKTLKLYVSEGLKINELEMFNTKVCYIGDIEQADVIVSTFKPGGADKMVTTENKIGNTISQTVWVCAKNNADAISLAEFIILRFHAQ